MADANPNAADSSTPAQGDDKGFTLDLSTGKAPTRRKRKRKGPAPVVQQTINLSTPKSEKPADPKADAGPSAKASAKPSRGSKSTSGGRRKERPAPRSGNSLADLLDAETLARLRGE